MVFWYWHLSSCLEMSLYSWGRIRWFFLGSPNSAWKKKSQFCQWEHGWQFKILTLVLSLGQLLQSQLHFQSYSMKDQSPGLSPSAMKFTSDRVPETATSARVHSECVRSNPKNRHNGVILQDKLKTAVLREKIAPLVLNQNHGQQNQLSKFPMGIAYLAKYPENIIELVSGQLSWSSHPSLLPLHGKGFPNLNLFAYSCRNHVDPQVIATEGGKWPFSLFWFFRPSTSG